MGVQVRNLNDIRADDQKLFEALTDIISQVHNIAEQGNLNPAAHPEPPPAISKLTVSASNGHFQAAIEDPNPIYRGVSYFVEHADNPNFTDSHTEHLGPSRNAHFFFGNATRYFRAYSSYGSTPASAPAYHGSEAEPIAVTGGGSIPGPTFLRSQGSGTGTPGQGLSGPGPIPFRSENGTPPIRKA